MNVTKIIDAFGYVIYAALALLAVWGAYNGILLYRSLIKKSIRDPGLLIDQVRDLCEARRVDAATRTRHQRGGVTQHVHGLLGHVTHCQSLVHQHIR